jgi:hypothetical protein
MLINMLDVHPSQSSNTLILLFFFWQSLILFIIPQHITFLYSFCLFVFYYKYFVLYEILKSHEWMRNFLSYYFFKKKIASITWNTYGQWWGSKFQLCTRMKMFAGANPKSLISKTYIIFLWLDQTPNNFIFYF